MINSGKLPAFLRSRLEGRETIRRVFGNSFWLFCEQILRMATGLLIGVWVARYLGPENYGWLNYALVTVGVVSSITSLGIGAVVVRELARVPAETASWMGAAFFLRATSAAIGFFACVVIAWRQWGGASHAGVLILIVATGIIFQTLDVVEMLFQARGESRVVAWVRMSVCVLGSVLRVVLILIDAPVIAFAAAGIAELAIMAVGWLWVAHRRGSGIMTWTCERARVVSMLRASWPLAVSGVAGTAQAYADQLVMGSLLGANELGQYAAALRLVNVFAFIPMVIYTVSAPEITLAKRDDELLYRRRLHNVYRLMFGLFVVTALAIILLGPPAARLLYGASYAGTATLLPWLAFRLFFANLGVARSLFVTNEGLLGFALFTSVAGAVVNVLLNLAVVPHWGARGAIVTSFISFGVSTFALEFLNRRAWANLRLMARAIFLPWQRFAG